MDKFKIAKQLTEKCNKNQVISQSLPEFFRDANYSRYYFNKD